MSILPIAARRILSQIALSWGGIVYLFRDEFTTPQTAPLTTPRTAEPGPGNTIIVDSQNIWNITANGLDPVNTPGATVADQPLVYAQSTYAAAVGLCAYMTFSRIAATGSGFNDTRIGFWALPRTLFISDLIGTQINSLGNVVIRPPNIVLLASITNDIIQRIWVIQRSAGSLLCMDISGAGPVLVWVDTFSTSVSGSLSAGLHTRGTNLRKCRVDDITIVQLGASFDNDWGLATTHLTSPAAATSFTHAANFIMPLQVARPTSGTMITRFRQQNASNYWRVTVNSSGDLALDEVVAGTPTNRGSAAGVVAASEWVTVKALDTTIQVANQTAKRISYTSATNFATATAGYIETYATGGAIADLSVWPVTLSAAALAELERIA